MTRILVLLFLVVALAGCGDSSPLFNTPAVPSVGPAGTTPALAGTPQGTLPAASQCQSRLFGRVLDPAGQPARSGSVDITNGQISASAVTDSNGLYGFAGLCAGTYNFTVTLQGRAPQALGDRIAVDGGNIVKFDIRTR